MTREDLRRGSAALLARHTADVDPYGLLEELAGFATASGFRSVGDELIGAAHILRTKNQRASDVRTVIVSQAGPSSRASESERAWYTHALAIIEWADHA